MNHSEFFKQKSSCFLNARSCRISSGSSSYQALALAGITVAGQKTAGMELELSNATHQRLVEGSEQSLLLEWQRKEMEPSGWETLQGAERSFSSVSVESH